MHAGAPRPSSQAAFSSLENQSQQGREVGEGSGGLPADVRFIEDPDRLACRIPQAS